MKTKPFNKFLAFILPKSVIAISLYPFGVYVRDDLYAYTVNHEKIHWEQQKEMVLMGYILMAILIGVISAFELSLWFCLIVASLPLTLFYLWYWVEWIVRLFRYGKWAYNHISFEQEAYLKQHLDDYLKYRKPFAWVKYLFS
jgi:hypothetical protein